MPNAPTTTSLFAEPSGTDRPANILAAARALAPSLARSRPLDRRLVADVMTTAFGASDAQGGWTWRDAYDAIEAATVIQVRRLAPQVARLEDAPAEIAALLAGVSTLGLTHSRRSEAQIALDQFSTPPQLAAMAVLAAQVRPGDRVLEPSAGTGLLAVVAEACGGTLSLNEIAPGRAALLDGLFPQCARTRHDGRHLADLLPEAGQLRRPRQSALLGPDRPSDRRPQVPGGRRPDGGHRAPDGSCGHGPAPRARGPRLGRLGDRLSGARLRPARNLCRDGAACRGPGVRPGLGRAAAPARRLAGHGRPDRQDRPANDGQAAGPDRAGRALAPAPSGSRPGPAVRTARLPRGRRAPDL